MYPVDSPAHRCLSVQLTVCLHVALALGTTAALWRLGLPIETTVPSFLAVGGVLLPLFWPLYTAFHPTHDEQ